MAEVVSLSNLANLQNETTAVGNINANNAAITTAFTDVLSRTGVSPNTMQANLDMNSNRIVNLAAPVGANDAARKADVDASGSASATAQALNAASSAAGAATSASNASASATAAAASAGASQANAIADVYSFDANTNTGVTPAIGGLKFNSATIGSVTVVAMNNQTNANTNPDIHTFIDHWADSTNTAKGYLEIRKVGATQNFAVFTVTGTTSQSGFRQIAVTNLSSGGTTFTAGDALAVVFFRSGDAGTAGAAGSGVTGGGPNLIAVYSASSTISQGAAAGSTGQALLQSSGAVPSWTSSPSYTTVTATGAMSASTYNGLNITPSASGVLTIVGGKTFSCANTLTISGTDASTLTIGTGAQLVGSVSNAIYFDNIPQNLQNTSYTLLIGDGEKHIYHANSDSSSRTYTIPSNTSVSYPVGTAITFVNAGGSTNTNALTIALTTDTLRFCGTTSGTGSRSLSVGGIATALKTAAGEWHISGTGLT